MQRDDDVYAGSAFNSFPLRPKVLNLFITERCNAECTMCVTNSHPHISRQTDIIESQAVEWLRQTAAIESIKAVCFVGGEALLRLGVVERLSAQCKAQGLVTSVVTNGFWAKTPELARKVLSRLHNAGLVRITLSSDVFHTDYIPLDRISNAITVAKE